MSFWDEFIRAENYQITEAAKRVNLSFEVRRFFEGLDAEPNGMYVWENTYQGRNVEADISFSAKDAEDGKRIARKLIEYFHISLPGFKRVNTKKMYSKAVNAKATVELDKGGTKYTLNLSISDIGVSEACELVEEDYPPETTKRYRIVCKEG